MYDKLDLLKLEVNNIKKMKVVLSGLICAILATSSIVTAFADGNFGTAIKGNNAIVDDNEYQEYLDSLSDEELQKVREKEKLLEEAENRVIPRSTTIYTIPNPNTFHMYQQETDVFCIPACIQSVLMYINGTSPWQVGIHIITKMNFAKIPAFINDYQSKCHYLLVTSPNAAKLVASIYVSVDVYEVPSFLRIEASNEDNLYYTTGGHCILAYGIYGDNSKILLADPLGGLVSGCPEKYDKSSTIMAKVTTDLCY